MDMKYKSTQNYLVWLPDGKKNQCSSVNNFFYDMGSNLTLRMEGPGLFASSKLTVHLRKNELPQ